MRRSASRVLSPGLYQGETANALWKYVQADRLTLDQALVLFDEALDLVDVQIPDTELATESLAVACKYGHPVSDLLYAIAARRHSAGVLTRDRRLIELLREMGIPSLL